MGTLNDVQCPCCGEAYGRDVLIVPPMETAGTTFDALRARAEKAEADFLACAQAAGIVYEAEGHASAPGPVERVVESIREGQRAQGEQMRAHRWDADYWRRNPDALFGALCDALAALDGGTG